MTLTMTGDRRDYVTAAATIIITTATMAVVVIVTGDTADRSSKDDGKKITTMITVVVRALTTRIPVLIVLLTASAKHRPGLGQRRTVRGAPPGARPAEGPRGAGDHPQLGPCPGRPPFVLNRRSIGLS